MEIGEVIKLPPSVENVRQMVQKSLEHDSIPQGYHYLRNTWFDSWLSRPSSTSFVLRIAIRSSPVIVVALCDLNLDPDERPYARDFEGTCIIELDTTPPQAFAFRCHIENDQVVAVPTPQLGH